MGVISSLSGNNVRRIEQFIRFCGQLVLNGFWTSLRKPQQNKLFSRPSNALTTFFSTEAILLVTLSVGLADGATVGSRVGLGTDIIVDYSDSREPQFSKDESQKGSTRLSHNYSSDYNLMEELPFIRIVSNFAVKCSTIASAMEPPPSLLCQPSTSY